MRVILPELRDAPKLLRDWDLIEPVEGSHCFRVEMLRRWILKYKPLSRVQEGLDRIEPAAESLYVMASGLYEGGWLEPATDLLRQALKLNPNHMRASELLADILLAQGQLSEARQLLERIHEYQPDAARPRLVQVLYAQAQTARNDDERLTLYSQIIDLEPEQSDAIAGRQRIWQQRGDDALQSDDLSGALKAYQAAGLADKVAEVEQEIRRRADVFISYSHHDAEWIQNWLLPRLEAANIRVWIDFRDFGPGSPILSEVDRAVSKSRKTLLVLTPNYLADEWVDLEQVLTRTMDSVTKQRQVLPLLLKQCELPLPIRTLAYLDFTNSDQVALQLERLIAAIRSEVGLPLPSIIQVPSIPIFEISREATLTPSQRELSPVSKERELGRAELTKLRQLLTDHFSESELRDLCFELGVEYDFLGGEGKAIKIIEIIRYLERRRQVSELVKLVQRLRPDISWEFMLRESREVQPGRVKVRQEASDTRQLKLDELGEKLAEYFDEEELMSLCFDMAVDYHDLPGIGKNSKARELVSYLERRARLPELVKMLRIQRPYISWGDILEKPDFEASVLRPQTLWPLPLTVIMGMALIVSIVATLFMWPMVERKFYLTRTPTPILAPLPITPYPVPRTCLMLRDTLVYAQPDETKNIGQKLGTDKSFSAIGQVGDGKWLIIQLPDSIITWYVLSADTKCTP